MMRGKIILLVLMSLAISATAQKKQIKQGNKLYEKGNYQDAARAYQEALAKDPKNTTGLFNLGNALYQQKQFEAARKALGATTQATKEKKGKSAASYNIGNTYMHEQKWEEAVQAYKQALRNNPQDPDAKYNLSYALAMLKKQQGGGGGKDDKKDKDQDKQNKDQQNQDQNKQDQNKQDQNKQDKNKDEKEEQDQRPQPQPSKLSEQQAEQLLNALQQEEKNLQDKMQKSKGTPVKVEKDW